MYHTILVYFILFLRLISVTLTAVFLLELAVIMVSQMFYCDFQNEGIPESDKGPTVEVAQPLSRGETPTGEQTLTDSEGKEEPDASATPPPPESQSTEPVVDLEQMDTYIESGMYQ